MSRAGRDHTRRFPALAAAIAELEPDALTLDGEVCIFDGQLVSRFEWLRERPKDETATPPIIMAFDCLWLAGRDLREQALSMRRDQLEQMLADHQHLLLPARRLADDGLKAWAQVLERGYEGLVPKDPASPYRGGRSLAWLKVKVPKYREGERGWEPKG